MVKSLHPLTWRGRPEKLEWESDKQALTRMLWRCCEVRTPSKQNRSLFQIRHSPEPEHISQVGVYLRKATNLLRLCIDLIPCRNHVIVLPEMIGQRVISSHHFGPKC